MPDERSPKQKRTAKKNKQKHHNRKMGFYYSFFTVILMFCLMQIGYGAILNVSKIISYKGKMITLENLLRQAQARNQDLKNEKKVVTSDNSLEGIARNNLKMAGEDEVLIIINKKPEDPVKKKKKQKFKLFRKIFEKQEDIKPNEQMVIPSEVVEE